MAPPSTEQSIDDLLTRLADWRRRAVLRHLAACDDDGPVVIETVAAAVAPDGADEDRLRIRLHHRHLPALDDAGLVEYDPDSRTVRYRRDERVETLLSLLDEEFE